MIKFSIITCTWNSASFVRQTIESVQCQTYPDVEHIFVDGGSVDGTLDLLHSVPGNIRVVTGVGGGIARAMNEGIRLATGDVIAHLHSDDYYLGADVLSKVSTAFEQSGCQWLFGRIMSDIDGVLVPEAYEVPRYSFKLFHRNNIVPHPASFVRRLVFEDLGLFNEELRYAMDYDFFLRIAKRYTPLQLDEYLTAFRRHDGSATHANFFKSFDEDFKVRCCHSEWYQLPEAFLRYCIRRRRHQKRRAR